MVMDFLRSGYRTTMRFFIGGQAYDAPVRWYLTAADAKYMPGGTCYYSRIWLQEDEVPIGGPGETTDRKGYSPKTAEGYRGQCHLGETSWYHDGQLPADILTRPPQSPLPGCCNPSLMYGVGQIILQGTATPYQSGQPVGHGQLVLRGIGWPFQAGRIVLAGFGRPYQSPYPPPPPATGQLVLQGTAIPYQIPLASPSYYYGSGTPETDGCSACPDGAAVQYRFSLAGISNGVCTDCANLDGDVTVTWVGGCTWQSPGVSVCGQPPVPWVLTIGASTIDLDGPISLIYHASRGGWDCLSPLLMPILFSGPACVGYPGSVTLTPV
jgi:hypothetical protein